VDVNKVLTRSAPAIRARSTLESEFKARERELAGMSNKSGAEYVAKKREFDADLTRRRNEELAKVLEIANRAIKDLSGREGIDLVLQEAVYIAPEFDLTERLLPLLR
jgi:outer membrane protein